MSTHADPCCGIAVRHWAMGATIANGVWWLIVTLLAALARAQVGALDTQTTAEGNDSSVWSKPRFVYLGLAILSPLLALLSFLLTYLTFRPPRPEVLVFRLRLAQIVSVGWAALTLAWASFGAYMAFGEAKGGIEKACATIDATCSKKYHALEWIHIPAEIISLILLVWMFFAFQSYRTSPELLSPSISSSSSSSKKSKSRSKAADEAAQPLTSNAAPSKSRRRWEGVQLVLDGGPRPRPRSKAELFTLPDEGVRARGGGVDGAGAGTREEQESEQEQK
ncbi:hypothetical protein JCM8097_002183 [Rhodosporidiobolus ruineniae]